MRRFVSAENPCRPGRPRDGDFSAAARNSSQVLAHSRVTLLFFRPRLGEMLQDAGQGLGSLMQALEESFPGVETDRSDGLKLILPAAWIHVRASNTEPLLRMAAEARSEAEVEELYARVLGLFEQSG